MQGRKATLFFLKEEGTYVELHLVVAMMLNDDHLSFEIIVNVGWGLSPAASSKEDDEESNKNLHSFGRYGVVWLMQKRKMSKQMEKSKTVDDSARRHQKLVSMSIKAK